MNFSDYVLIEGTVIDRLTDLRRARREMTPREAPMSILAKLLYLASALRVRPRAIDRYIDYFGDRLPHQR